MIYIAKTKNRAKSEKYFLIWVSQINEAETQVLCLDLPTLFSVIYLLVLELLRNLTLLSNNLKIFNVNMAIFTLFWVVFLAIDPNQSTLDPKYYTFLESS